MLTLEMVKADLRIIHDSDDDLLSQLIASAEQECLRFLGRDELPTLPYELPSELASEEVPSSEDPVVPDVLRGMMLVIRADYDGMTPDDRRAWRRAAEDLWYPYRTGLGI